MGLRRKRNPRDRSHPLAERIFPTVLRRAVSKPARYPFLERNIATSAPDRKSIIRRCKWEHDLFLSKRDSEEAHLLACRSDWELVLNVKSAWLLQDGDDEAKKFASTANLRLEVNRYTEDPEHAHSQPSLRNYVLAYDGALTWLSDGSFEDNPGNIRIGSSSRWKNNKGQSLVWLSIHNQEDAEDIGGPDAMDTQDSQEESLAGWETEKLVVVTESGSLASYGDTTIEMRSIKTPGVAMLLDLNLGWKASFRRHLRPVPRLIRPALPLEKVTFKSNDGSIQTTNEPQIQVVEQKIVAGWCCPLPLCEPLNFGSWERLHHHMQREHPKIEAEPVDYFAVQIRKRRTKKDMAGESVFTSNRIENGTLLDRLHELDKFWQGGEYMHLVQEREEIICDWVHFSSKRHFIMCMWNRWQAEKGPFLVHSGRIYVCDWVDRYHDLLVKYNLGVEMRDHLMIFVEYKLIDSITVLMAMRKLKPQKDSSKRINLSQQHQYSEGTVQLVN